MTVAWTLTKVFTSSWWDLQCQDSKVQFVVVLFYVVSLHAQIFGNVTRTLNCSYCI